MREGPKIRRACDEYERGSVRIFLTFLVRFCVKTKMNKA